jgi:mRNA interferase MazF
VAVPFPLADRQATKRRPALVVSSDAFNETHDQLILAMITTAARSRWPSDVPISDPAKAGLVISSLIRMKLFTLDQSLVVRTIGSLSHPDADAAGKAVERYLGLPAKTKR